MPPQIDTTQRQVRQNVGSRLIRNSSSTDTCIGLCCGHVHAGQHRTALIPDSTTDLRGRLRPCIRAGYGGSQQSGEQSDPRRFIRSPVKSDDNSGPETQITSGSFFGS